MNRPILLLTCSTFVLASMTNSFSRAWADGGVAGQAYFSIPFSTPDNSAGEPSFGLRLDRKVDADPTFAIDALPGADDPYRPAMVDMQFSDEGPKALMFGGMDALPVVGPALGFHGGLGNASISQEQEDQEHIWIFGGGAIGLGLIICALAGCFGGGDGGEGHETQVCWVARAVYGEHDPRWRMFRNWLMEDAPGWFRALYVAHGRRFAAYVADRPALKRAIRAWMDTRIARTA
jgi:hypothetical protein